jgi:hypothetical protein
MRQSREEIDHLADLKAKAHSLKQDWKKITDHRRAKSSTPESDSANDIRIIRPKWDVA